MRTLARFLDRRTLRERARAGSVVGRVQKWITGSTQAVG